MKTHIDRLGRKDAINWVTAVVAIVLMVPAAIVSAGVDFSGREVAFIAIILFRVSVMLAIFALGKAALTRFARIRPQPLITLGTFWAAIIIATTIFDLLLVVNGFAEESQLSQRLRTTFLGSTAALVLSSLLVTYARDFSRSNAELIQKLEELQRSKADAGELILARKAQLISTIKDSINAELAHFGGANPVTDSTVMQTLIDDVVRPLSYSLNRDFPVDDTVDALPEEKTIDWFRVVQAAFAASPFRWVAFPIGIGLISASFLILNFGLVGIYGTVLLLALSAGMFWGFGVVWRFLPQRLPTAIRALVFSAAHLPVGIATSWAVTMVTGFNLLLPIRFWSFVAIVMLISWSVTLVAATLRLLRDTNDTLNATVEELKREVIITSNSYRQLHKGISRLLHGPVQEAITSSMLRLQGGSDTVGISGYADVIRERIAVALELLNQPALPVTDLKKVLEELQELWSGVVSINYSVADSDSKLIGSDRMASFAVAELVREACSNATRHGHANRIDISLKVVARERAIELVVDNDGAPIPRSSQPGIGSQLFDEQTLSWSRKRVGSRVRVRAKLPMSQELVNAEA
jgi:signal transduction histidine kinase